MTQDPVSARESSTGIVAAVPRKSWPPGGTLSKGDWVRLVIWSVPLIFMGATMYVSVDNLSAQATAHDLHLDKLDRTQGELNGDQRVLREKVGEVCKKQDRLIRTTDKMDDKLDGQGEDLSAIKAKLKIK